MWFKQGQRPTPNACGRQLQGLLAEFVRVREAIIRVLGPGRKEIEVRCFLAGERGVGVSWQREE